MGGFVLGCGKLGWLLLELSYAKVLTPSSRLLKRSAHAEDRPAIFVAQFALSHACWLITYQLAGWLGHSFGLGTVMLVLGGISAVSLIIALVFWPRGGESNEPQEHHHNDLPADHPHLQEHGGDQKGQGRRTYRHLFAIDDKHRIWPTHG